MDDSDGAYGKFADLMSWEGASPTDEADMNEYLRLVEKGIEKLNRSHREIIALRLDHDLPYEEIAAILGIGCGTVKSRIARARGSLRARMADASPELMEDGPALLSVRRKLRVGLVRS